MRHSLVAFVLLLAVLAPVSAAQAQYTPKLLVDVVPGTGSGVPYSFAASGGRMYFSAQNSTINGTDLWAYTPAAGTTTLEADMRPGGFSASVLLDIDGTLYFPYRPSSSTLRFASFDPATKTFTAQSNSLGASLMPTRFARLGTKHYFTVADALYVFDPVAKTLALAFATSATTPKTLSIAVAFDGKVYFTGTTTAQGRELYAFDPATGTYSIPIDYKPGAASSNATPWSVIGGRLIVSATNPTGNVSTLWALSPGATAFTALSPAGAAPADVGEPVEVGGQILFSGFRSDVGSELWRYDPATGTTSLVADLTPGANGSSIRGLVAFDGKAFFSAQVPGKGTELWYTDGQTAPQLTADLWPDDGNGADISFNSPARVFGNRLFFRAQSPTTGMEPWYIEAQPVANEEADLPGVAAFALAPNPARGAATVTLALDAPQASAAVTVHDVLGREVARLHDGPMAAGAHRLPVPMLAPGVYLVRLAVGGDVRTRRLTVAR